MQLWPTPQLVLHPLPPPIPLPPSRYPPGAPFPTPPFPPAQRNWQGDGQRVGWLVLGFALPQRAVVTDGIPQCEAGFIQRRFQHLLIRFHNGDGGPYIAGTPSMVTCVSSSVSMTVAVSAGLRGVESA